MVLYKVLKCPKCEIFQVSQANKVFKCVNCNSTTQFSKLKIIFSSENPKDATNILQNLKKEIHLKNSSNTSFFSYK